MKKYILFDIEFTAWKNSLKENWSNPNEYREIIQISALKINNGEILEKFNIFVKPNINKELSKYIQKLTGITNNKLNKKGITFRKAIHKFYNFSKYYPLYSYGNDYNVIKENLFLNNIDKRSKFFDVRWKQKFNDFKQVLKKNSNINPSKYTSGTVYKAFNIKISERHKAHNAVNDVNSMFLVCKKIL
jgi:DNA polymerase III alpha subunit (gram-positive type)